MQKGFSLIQVAVILTVAAIIMASFIPGGGGGDADKVRLTYERMQKVEEATRAFMAANYRRPCPSDSTLATSHADFGKEASVAGDCIATGTIKANFSDMQSRNGGTAAGSRVYTSGASGSNPTVGMHVSDANSYVAQGTRVLASTSTTVTMDSLPIDDGSSVGYFTKLVAGGVPVRTLGLPDEYALDGYGRRLAYMVDNRATYPRNCHDLQSQGAKGDVEILSAYNASTSLDYTMWALMSYGKDGHGAFPANGSTLANRLDTGATDTDARNNAFAATGAMSTISYFTGGLVQKTATSTFDDIVWYQETSKNTCCVGPMCGLGFRLEGTGLAETMWNQIATGDINGDGIQDMVVAMPQDTSGSPKVYVIFGKKTRWPVPPYYRSLAKLNDLDGFGISIPVNAENQQPVTLATGDVNGDGYDDIVIGTALDSPVTDATSPCTTGTPCQQFWVLFGGTGAVTTTGPPTQSASPWPTLPTYFDLSTLNGTNGFVVTDPANPAIPGPVATGDFNGDSIKDLLLVSGDSSTCTTPCNFNAYVIFGKTSAWATLTSPTNLETLWDDGTAPMNGSGGFRITTTHATADLSMIALGSATGDNNVIATGDVNGDSYDDIILRGTAYIGAKNSYGSVYVIFGRASSAYGTDNWLAAAPNFTTTFADVNLATELGDTFTGGARKAIRFYDTTADSASNPFGFYLKTADLNGDGIKDLLLSGLSDYIYGYHGAWSSAEINISASNSFKIDYETDKPASAGICADVNCIASMAVADMNGDNLPDIILGNRFSQNASGNTDAGSVYVLYQPATGWATSTSLYAADGTVSSGFQVDGLNICDAAGIVEAADINKDGKPDLIVGAPGHENSGGACPTDDPPTNGAIYVLYGRKNVTWPSTTSLSTIGENSVASPEEEEPDPPEEM